jgi:hypothetical protein
VRDKTVAHLVGYDFNRNKMLVLREVVHEPNTSMPIIHPSLLTLEDGKPATQRIIDMPGQVQVDLVNLNYEVITPQKQDWQANINNLQNQFRQNQIEIHPSCKFTVVSLSSGQFNKQKSDFARSETIGHCDAIASLMYAARQLNKDNPYPKMNHGTDGYFCRKPPVDNEETVGMAIQQKSFMQGTGMKKFGAFKK